METDYKDMAVLATSAKAGSELRDLRAGRAGEATALLEQVIIKGDLAVLQPHERVEYYRAVCQAAGLNPLSRPFDYLVLSGRLTLYANKGCSEQLRQIHNVSVSRLEKDFKEVNGETLYVITAHVKDGDGREDESTGAVSIGANLKGEALANALMKAETKAKRRATLSICGLGMLDETEVDTIPGAQRVQFQEPPPTAKVLPIRSDVVPETGEIIDNGPAPLTEAEQHAAEAHDQPRFATQKNSEATIQAKAWFHATIREKLGIEHPEACALLGVESISKELPQLTLGQTLDSLQDAIDQRDANAALAAEPEDRLAKAALKMLGK